MSVGTMQTSMPGASQRRPAVQQTTAQTGKLSKSHGGITPTLLTSWIPPALNGKNSSSHKTLRT